MELEAWINLVIAIAPAIVSVISVVTAVLVGIKKVKSSVSETTTTSKKINKEVEGLKEVNSVLLKENAELKSNMETIIAKLDKVHVTKRK